MYDDLEEIAMSMTFTIPDPGYEERIRASFKRQMFMEFIGATLANVRPGYCEIHLPYKKELSRQHGFFHAGVIGTLSVPITPAWKKPCCRDSSFLYGKWISQYPGRTFASVAPINSINICRLKLARILSS